MIAIVKATGGSNLNSISYALERINQDHRVTNDPEVIQSAAGVILPGVGNAAHAMRSLEEYNLTERLKNLSQPVLGICLGMQILFDKSEEGNTECLGVFEGIVEKMKTEYPLPHIGWNKVQPQSDDPLFEGLSNEDYFYFAHTYRAPTGVTTTAVSEYPTHFPVAVKKNNYMGVQFHPEKSAKNGERLLLNFVKEVRK